VQHKNERWRGIIAGWQRKETAREEKLSSLTNKSYSENKGDLSSIAHDEKMEEADDIQYSLILDSGDAHLLGGRRNVHDVTGDPVAMQSDLEVVNDDR